MFARFGVEPRKLFTIYPEYQIPEEQKKAFQQDRTGCIVGQKTADRLGMKIGDRVTLVGDIFPVRLELTVRGIYNSPRDNEILYFSWDYLNEGLHNEIRDTVGTFVILADSPQAVATIPEAIDSMFRNSPLQTKTETERAFELSFIGFLGNVKAFMGVIFVAVTFAILLVSANTMAMSVRERIREVGILKTLGFTPGAILGMIVAESAVIALTGGVIGLGLAYLVCIGLHQVPSTFLNMPDITIPPMLSLACLAIAAVIGMASSTWPAWSASRKSIVEALRSAN
jgi:putative ABC transport system permease protein